MNTTHRASDIVLPEHKNRTHLRVCNRWLQYLICGYLGVGLLGFASAQAGITLPYLTDLPSTLAHVKTTQKPLLILFSQADCPYCHQVREQFLKHIYQQPSSPVIVREVQHDSTTLIQIGSNQTVTAQAFSRSKSIRFYPTVILYDNLMNELSQPLLGSDRSGFYGAYLDRNIEQAVSAIKQLPKK